MHIEVFYLVIPDKKKIIFSCTYADKKQKKNIQK